MADVALAGADVLSGSEKGALALGGVSSGLDFISNLWNNILQTKYAREDRDFRNMVYQETKQREDNAIQRRVADAFSAGLSPLAVVGSGASASAGGSSTSVNSPIIHELGGSLSSILPDASLVSERLSNSQRSLADSVYTRWQTKRVEDSYDNFLKSLEVEAEELDVDLKNLSNDKIVSTLMNSLLNDSEYQEQFKINEFATFELRTIHFVNQPA